jgi:hypothetical protein
MKVTVWSRSQMMLIYDAFILFRTVLNFGGTSNYEFPVMNDIALEFIWNGIYINTVWSFIAAICLKNMIDSIDDYSDPHIKLQTYYQFMVQGFITYSQILRNPFGSSLQYNLDRILFWVSGMIRCACQLHFQPL